MLELAAYKAARSTAFDQACRWSDDRLLAPASNPCLGLMPDLIAITRGMHLTDETRESILARTASFWLPWLDIATRAQGGLSPKL